MGQSTVKTPFQRSEKRIKKDDVLLHYLNEQMTIQNEKTHEEHSRKLQSDSKNSDYKFSGHTLDRFTQIDWKTPTNWSVSTGRNKGVFRGTRRNRRLIMIKINKGSGS